MIFDGRGITLRLQSGYIYHAPAVISYAGVEIGTVGGTCIARIHDGKTSLAVFLFIDVHAVVAMGKKRIIKEFREAQVVFAPQRGRIILEIPGIKIRNKIRYYLI